jgi:hypothetical protein
MTEDLSLREAAKAAQANLRAAEQNLEHARTGFETAVRRLYVEGEAIREIALLLGLSHQRIHQLVGGKPQTWWQRLTGGRDEPSRNCSFCGKPAKSVAKLVAGPSVHICDGCIDAAASALGAQSVHDGGLPFEQLAAQSRQRCSFCGKRSAAIPRVSASGHQICKPCLELANDIIANEHPPSG